MDNPPHGPLRITEMDGVTIPGRTIRKPFDDHPDSCPDVNSLSDPFRIPRPSLILTLSYPTLTLPHHYLYSPSKISYLTYPESNHTLWTNRHHWCSWSYPSVGEPTAAPGASLHAAHGRVSGAGFCGLSPHETQFKWVGVWGCSCSFF